MMKHAGLLLVAALAGGTIGCGSNDPTDSGIDSGVAVDTGVDTGTATDVPRDTRDTGTPTDRPIMSSDPCAMSALVDLTTVMPGTDGAVHWTGNNNSATEGGGPAAPMGCLGGDGTVGYIKAFRYTMRTTARLTASTANAGTAMAMDTVAMIANTCSATAMIVACNDDLDTGMGMYQSRVSTTGTVAAGTTVYIFVGTYVPTESGQTGNIELTIREGSGDAGG